MEARSFTPPMHHRYFPLSTPLLLAAALPLLVCEPSLAQGLPVATPSCGVAVAPMALLGWPNLFCHPQEVTADVLVFRSTSPPSGAIKPTVITLQSARGQYLGISFFESRLDSAGDQWRSAAWTAIAGSSLILGDSLNQYSFSFDAEGSIDGPSAGGLFTASTLALLLGNSLQRDVTMTGTINPDGSIGPVGAFR
jgi:hypothetical protein